MIVFYRAGTQGYAVPKSHVLDKSIVVHSPVDWTLIPGLEDDSCGRLLGQVADYFQGSDINYEFKVVDSTGHVHARMETNPNVALAGRAA